MNGGCFGKILTFILGVIVGIVLIAGTLAGVVYYAIAGVTINDVESIADTKFDVIDENAEIRDKSLLEIFDLVKGGNLSKTTVSDAKKTYGIDIISIIENTLDITIDDDAKADLNSVEVLNIFKDDNLKKILNCITLRTVLDKAGVDITTGLGSKPILQEHLDEPVIDGLNSIMTSLEINDMTIAEMEYLLGISFGGEGVLDSLESYKISALNDAINNVTFENIIPDFDRDMYIYVSDGTYSRGTLTPLTSYKSLLAEGYFSVRAEGAGRLDGVTYYSYNEEEGTFKEDDAGNYYVASGKTLPDFRSRYSCKMVDGALDTSTLTANRFGAYYLDAGDVMSINRYDADGTTQNDFGQYYYPYANDNSGEYYLMYACIKTQIADTDPAEYEYKMVAREYVSATTVDYFETTPERYDITAEKQLVSSILGEWALAHIGTSESILKALADETLNTMDGAIGTMKLNDVIEINDSSAAILQELKNSTIDNLAEDIKKIKLSSLTTVYKYNKIRVATAEELANANVKKYVALTNTYGTDYIGVYEECYLESDTELTTPYYLVRFHDDYDYGTNADASTKYVITEKKSNEVIIYMSDESVGDLEGTDISNLVNKAAIKGVMNIDGDVFVKSTEVYDSSTPDAYADYYTYFNKNGDWDDLDNNGTPDEDVITGYFKAVDSTVTDGTELYIKLYSGTSNAVIKKLAITPIYELANRIDDVVDNTMLKDMIDINDKNIVEKKSDGEYVQLKVGQNYLGAYSVGYFDGVDTPVYYVKWVDGMATSDLELEGGTPIRLTVVQKASSAIMVKLSEKMIGKLSADISTIIDETKLYEVVDMSGDVYREKISTDTAGTFYVFKDEFFKIATTEDLADDEITKYVKIISGSDSAIMKKLALMPINKVSTNMQKVIDETTLSEVITIKDKNILEESLTGGYVALKSGTTYYGPYKTGYLENDDTPIYYVKWVDGMETTDLEMDGAVVKKYKVIQEADNAIMCQMAEKKIGSMASGVQDIIDKTELNEVMDINGDIFRDKTGSDTTTELYVYDTDFYRLATDDETADVSVKKYVRVITGSDNAIIKKLALIKVNQLSSRMQTIIDETKLSEVITIQEKNVLEVATDGKYVELKKGLTYYGTYDVGYLYGDATKTNINFVKYSSTMDITYIEGGASATRYNIKTSANSGIMSYVADMRIVDMSGKMQSVVNEAVLSEVIDISGDVYIKLSATDYANAVTEAGTDTIYYIKDDIYYTADSTSGATEYYKKVYSGTSNTVLKKISTITVQELASGNILTDAVNDCKLSEIMTINGDTYTEYDMSVGVVDKEIYYIDSNGLYLSVGFNKSSATAENGDYIKEGSTYVEIKAANRYTDNTGTTQSNSGDFLKYNETYYDLTAVTIYKRSVTSDKYYYISTVGTSNAIIKKISTITVKQLSTGNALTEAVKDCKLKDVLSTSDSNSILYQLQESRIGNMEDDIQDVMKNATVNDINNWGNLELTDLDKTIIGTSKVIGEMKIDEFLQAAINALKSTT